MHLKDKPVSAAEGPQLQKLRTDSLDELCKNFEWSRPVNDFLTPRATFQTLLQSLTNHGYWFDSVTLLAHALPQREAIWWAARVCDDYLSVVDIDEAQGDAERAVLALARDWVREPKEEIRLAVHTSAVQLANRLPSHWAGMSVFWATGNITPDTGVSTPPPPYLYARGVSAAIDLAASLAIQDREALYARAIARGLDVASGGDGEKLITL
jgi:hypothetical protein